MTPSADMRVLGDRSSSASRLLSFSCLAIAAQISPTLAQSQKTAPVQVETCILNTGDAASRERLSKPRLKLSPAEVIKTCDRALSEMAKADDAEYIRLKEGNRPRLVRGWIHPQRAYPEVMRRAVARQIRAGVFSDDQEHAYDGYTLVIELLRSTGGIRLDALPVDPKLRADLVWVLLARASLLEVKPYSSVGSAKADLDLALKIAPNGPDDNAPNRSAFVELHLSLTGIKQQIEQLLKKENADNIRIQESSAKYALDRGAFASARDSYEKLLTLVTEHGKRAEIQTRIAFTYCKELKLCTLAASECQAIRGKSLEAAKQAIMEALAAQRDPVESQVYGYQLGELISQSLLLRAQCRVARTNLVTQSDVRESIAEAEKAIEISLPLGDSKKSVDELMISLKRLQAERATSR